MGECHRDQALDVDLLDAVASAASECGVVLDPGDGVGDGVAVAGFDDFADLARSDGPQGGDALNGGEAEVVAGYGGGGLAADPCDVAGQFAGVEGFAAVGLGEHLACDLGADRSPFGFLDRPVPRQPGRAVAGSEGLGAAGAELVGVLVDLVGSSEHAGAVDLAVGFALCPGVALDLSGVGVAPFTEQQAHLFLGDGLVKPKI